MKRIKVTNYIAKFTVSNGVGHIRLFFNKSKPFTFPPLSREKFDTILNILNIEGYVGWDGSSFYNQEDIEDESFNT